MGDEDGRRCSASTFQLQSPLLLLLLSKEVQRWFLRGSFGRVPSFIILNGRKEVCIAFEIDVHCVVVRFLEFFLPLSLLFSLFVVRFFFVMQSNNHAYNFFNTQLFKILFKKKKNLVFPFNSTQSRPIDLTNHCGVQITLLPRRNHDQVKSLPNPKSKREKKKFPFPPNNFSTCLAESIAQHVIRSAVVTKQQSRSVRQRIEKVLLIKLPFAPLPPLSYIYKTCDTLSSFFHRRTNLRSGATAVYSGDTEKQKESRRPTRCEHANLWYLRKICWTASCWEFSQLYIYM